MAIQKTDIKLMGSQRLTDFYDGGGQMTGAEIIDGQVNNLFPDISRLDRVYGRVSLRKAYPAVMTSNTDMYYGAHAIITEPPEDDNVHVTLFSTGDFYDIRDNARNRIESYVSIAQELIWRPLNDQLEGQRAITVFAKPGTTRPEISDTIVLKNSSTGAQQYARITSLSAEDVQFAHTTYGNFTLEVLTLGLSAALQYTFPGIEATPFTTKAVTRVHATVVADASNYYGVSRLAQPATLGAMNFWVNSIYNQLVPTSQIETALVDQRMGGNNVTHIAKGAPGSLTFSGTRSNTANVIHLPSGVLPGSLTLSVSGYTFRDLRGRLVIDGADGGFGGSVDYTSGQVVVERTSAWSATVTLTATPAVAVAQALVSREIKIELANRAYNYTPNLTGPLPSPGSITVSYMAQGKWYELYDNGAGVLVGNEDGIGTGTINYATGSMILTVGALPDVGSSIIFHWGHDIEIVDRAGELAPQPVPVRHQLPHQGIKSGSIIITWMDGATPKTATDNGQGGLTGDASGVINYGLGEVLFIPATLPPSDTEYQVQYEQRTAGQASIASGDWSTADDNITLTVPGAPLRPGSVALEWTSMRATVKRPMESAPQTAPYIYRLRDNGQGALIDPALGPVGSLNYTTGQATFTARHNYSYYDYRFFYNGHFVTSSMIRVLVTGKDAFPQSIVATYATDTVEGWLPETDSIAQPALRLDLCPTSLHQIVPGSVEFALGGATYYDDAAGKLYRNRSASTGAGTLSGEINYNTGIATLTSYPAMGSTLLSLTSLLTRDGGFAPESFVFRTPGAPVRDASLSVRATTPDGALLTAIAQNSGAVSDSGIEGHIDTQTGVVRLRFGELVAAAGNEGEPWYHPSLVNNGMIWRPQGVIPETALYNCVIFSFLPLDAQLLGIEPIRLPLDGRVPIFKSGNVAVVHHTADELLPDNLTAGQSVTLARDRLALCDIRDQEGTLVDEALYTLDLAAGTLTFATPLDLSAYTQPLVAAHRIEDMVLISEAQINGLIRTVGPLTHAYPANETQVSSALIFGDLAARIVRSYTQKTWDNVWRDQRQGDDSTAKYNDLIYPIELTNKGSIAQRWAIVFTGASTFNVVSERMGIIATGTTGSDVAPINTATGVPYFRIDYRGWGTGWASGNVLRFDTSAANAPVWLARTTMQGPVEEPTDDFVIQIRGDAN